MCKKRSSLPLSRHWLIFFSILLCAIRGSAQSIWLGTTSSDWFTTANWNPTLPNAATSANFVNGGNAQILKQGAVTSALVLDPTGNVSATVLVSGATATLDVVGAITLAPDSDLAAVTSTLTIQNGATVTATSIDLAAGGQLNVGAGGVGGTLNVLSIANSGVTTFNLTDTTTLSANFTGTEGGTGTITKTGSGTVTLTGTIAGSVLTITGGTLAVSSIANLNAPVTVTGTSSIFKINGGVSEEEPEITVEAGGTLDNAGTLNATSLVTLGPPETVGTANVINRATGTITGTAESFDGLDFNVPGSLQNSGTISGDIANGGVDGVAFANGGSVTNNAGGIITGADRGVVSALPVLPEAGISEQAAAIAAQAADPPAVIVTNSGTISGATGVEIDTGGSVTNNAGGIIRGTGGEGVGDGIGVAALPNSGVAPEPLAVANSGTISGTNTAIDLEGGGSITNNSGASIVAGAGNPAVIANGGPLIFLNAGTITGSVTLDTLPGTAANFANQATLVTGGIIAGDLNLGTNPGTILTLDGAGIEALSKAVTGLITNAGSVIKQGTGTWVVDKSVGNNPGGTTVESGTLIDALTNALGTGPITVTGNASLLQISQGVEIANPNQITLTDGGSIDNAGTISTPPGGLISGTGGGNITNEETGIITNTAGNAVIFNAGGNLLNLAGALVQSNTAAGVFSTGGQTTITNSGTISGLIGINLTGGGSVTNNAGGVISGRSGLAILNAGGPIKFSNAGTINGNVLLGNFANTAQLFSGGRINGNLNLGNSAASNLILDGSTDQSLSQAISGTIANAGSLTKQGSANWTVDVAMSAPVSTNILAGVLTVNSSLTSPLVTVQAGAMLKGTGNVLGNVVNLGTISPGNSPGTLTIGGNFTQGAGGTYNVEIFSPQNYSRLVVLGHASLDGTLHLTLASGFRFQPGETFTVLTAQGISGTFRTISGNSSVQVTYANGQVIVNPAAAPKVQASDIHLSDGTPISTTALLADYTFYGFGSLSERMALGLIPLEDTGKQDAVSLTFDAGEFDIQGQHGQTYTIPIAGGFKINDRVRLDYEIPLQYITLDNTSLFQAGLTLDLPVKVIIPTADQPWSWIVTPTAALATSGSKEIIGGGALTNVFSYQWHGITATYGNYISFFEGDLLTSDDPKFPSGVSQQIMKNGLRLDVPVAKSWIVEAYGIYTQFFQPAAISSYWTIGVEVGHHFTWDIEGRRLDLGYLSLGLYSEIGNQYNQYHSGHAQIGSAWRF
jgi:fibronectin-binding autotransporter adhesin